MKLLNIFAFTNNNIISIAGSNGKTDILITTFDITSNTFTEPN